MSDEILSSSKSKCGDLDSPKIHPKSPKTPPPPRTPPTPQNINKPLLLSDEQKSNLSKDALFDYICDIENYVGALESQTSNQEGSVLSVYLLSISFFIHTVLSIQRKQSSSCYLTNFNFALY
uniref:Uncharacterized protein n=1 Tax=Cacopsylla melanoneura TaxID=428564 RepID=A0A8D9A960_9HEMI